MKKNCLNCDKEIKVKPSQYDRKKYCSGICKTEYQKNNPPQFWEEMNKKMKVSCSFCKNAILRKPSTINNTNFCNVDCKRLYQLKNGPYYGPNWLSQRREVILLVRIVVLQNRIMVENFLYII